MGILSSLFGGGRRQAPPRDNFEIIAFNIGQINGVIQTDFATHLSSEDEILLATAVVDLLAYLSEGTVTFDDIRAALHVAKRGKCRIGFVEQQHEKGVSDFEVMLGTGSVRDLLLNFTLQIECLIFRADSQIREDKLLASVLSKKNAISRALRQGLSAAKQGNIAPEIGGLVQRFFLDQEFAELRSQVENK